MYDVDVIYQIQTWVKKKHEKLSKKKRSEIYRSEVDR